MHIRPTNMAAAFINATANAEHKFHALRKPKVDHWVARRVALLADKPGFAVVAEHDKSPKKPVLRKQLTSAETRGIEAGVVDLVETTHLERMACCAHIEDGEGGLD